jgi:hypothetical protein
MNGNLLTIIVALRQTMKQLTVVIASILTENTEHRTELLTTKPRRSVVLVLDVLICVDACRWIAFDLRKVKVNLSLCLTNYHYSEKAYSGGGCIDPPFLDLGTSWRLLCDLRNYI